MSVLKIMIALPVLAFLAVLGIVGTHVATCLMHDYIMRKWPHSLLGRKLRRRSGVRRRAEHDEKVKRARWISGSVLFLALSASALDPGARIMEDTARMLDGMPVLIVMTAVGERVEDGAQVLIFTRIADRRKTVATMPASGIYPTGIFRYRVWREDGWQWIHEIPYSDGSVRTVEVSQ